MAPFIPIQPATRRRRQVPNRAVARQAPATVTVVASPAPASGNLDTGSIAAIVLGVILAIIIILWIVNWISSQQETDARQRRYYRETKRPHSRGRRSQEVRTS